eukprot:TRINITY_DN8331_c0_g1_i1.p1 TRINITY_DN8331_c0_g1~~TRINITY_DN8331_c0_g1_i1.p1  ORF type:complete len:269 (+),score=30.76 TRINITY_DN8331_c0_g1_i1:45-851(+)
MSVRSGSVVVITGASSGIGKSLALKYAQRGCRLVLAARSEAALKEVANICISRGAQAIAIPTDVSKESDSRKLIEAAISHFHQIDVLILNAGISYHAPFRQNEGLSAYRKMMDVNYFGYVYCTYFALPHLIDSGGRIGVLGSLSGELGLPFRSGYCATKFAVRGFFESLRMEIPESVAITIVSPGTVNTEMREHAIKSTSEVEFSEDDSKKMSVEECTDFVVDAIDKRKKSEILTLSGKLAVVFKPLLPDVVAYIAKRKAGGQVTSKL